MLQFEEWLADDRADELLADLQTRKDLHLRELEAATSDQELIRAGHFVQADALVIAYLRQRITAARAEKKNERRN